MDTDTSQLAEVATVSDRGLSPALFTAVTWKWYLWARKLTATYC